MKLSNNFYNWLFILLFLILIARLLNAFIENSIAEVFWFCVATLFMLVIGLYLKSNLLISSTLVSSFIIEIFWFIDVISFIFRKKLVLGIAEYLFVLNPLSFMINFYHLFLLLLPPFIILINRDLHKYSWVLSSLYFLFVELITLITQYSTHNINCVRAYCQFGVFNFIYYFKQSSLPFFIFNWFFITLFIFIPTYGLFYLVLYGKSADKIKILNFLIWYFCILDFLLIFISLRSFLNFLVLL